MKRILAFLEQAVKILLIAAVVVWLADWALFRVKLTRAKAFDTVVVEQFLGTALKGNKTEYDYVGKAPVNCARSLFPHGGASPCWWLRRHTTQWE